MSPKHCLRFQALDVLQKCLVLKQWLMAPRPSCYLKSGPKDCSYTLHSSNHGDQIVPIICQPTGVYKNKKKRFNSFNYLLYNLRGLNIKNLATLVEVWQPSTGSCDAGGKRPFFLVTNAPCQNLVLGTMRLQLQVLSLLINSSKVNFGNELKEKQMREVYIK